MKMREVKKQIIDCIRESTGLELSVEDVTESPVADLASNVAFKLAGGKEKSPKEVAEELARKLKPSDLIARVDAVNGYLNFYLDYSKLAEKVLADAVKEDYGRGENRNQKIILEHTSINPSGPVHVGRVRNSLIGDSLKRILSYAGYDVETHYFVNDVGKQIAIIALGLEENLPLDSKLELKYKKYAWELGRGDFLIFLSYEAANKKFEKDEEFKEKVQGLIQKAENGDTESLEKITKAADTCLKGQKETYERLGIRFDVFDYESKYIRNGAVKKVLDFLKKTDYWSSSESGTGLDLSSFGLERRQGVSILERSDGTSVYLARDIAYHLEKLERGNRWINVLGEDHKFEFQELKTILEEIYGVKKEVEVVHYSFVSFEGMELSTRKGLTAPVDQLLDEAVEKAEQEIRERKITSNEIAPQIGYGAVKYHIVKTNPNKPITFRWSDALSFDGEAAPYIQYAHARSCRILEKSGVELGEIDATGLDYIKLNDFEKNLVKELSIYPEAVEKAARDLRPDYITSYLYRLASAYSRFYKECQVLETGDENTERVRLLLVDATRNVIKSGLNLLGIEAPERM